jgi:hypothetical protein
VVFEEYILEKTVATSQGKRKYQARQCWDCAAHKETARQGTIGNAVIFPCIKVLALRYFIL